MQATSNQDGHRCWDLAWKDVGAVETFSPHSEVIETLKWGYLQDDLPFKEGRALEVGCGSGHIGALLADAGFEVTFLDYSAAALECARRSFTRLRNRERKTYVQGDACALPFAAGTFDLVISCGLLEHFENPQPAVNEMVRVLKPGGLFYADICPDKFSLLRLIERMRSRPPGWYERRMDAGAIRAMVEQAGLRVIRLFPAGVLPPRSLPLVHHIPGFTWVYRAMVSGLSGFWRRLDGTRLAQWLGSYYYVSARLPITPGQTLRNEILNSAVTGNTSGTVHLT